MGKGMAACFCHCPNKRVGSVGFVRLSKSDELNISPETPHYYARNKQSRSRERSDFKAEHEIGSNCPIAV